MSSPARACSCALFNGTEQQQVQKSLNAADLVLVAKIRRVAQTTSFEYPDWPVVTEETQLVVLEVLKGSDNYFAGQPLVSRTQVARGMCGLSIRNDPGWMMEIQGEAEIPVAFTDTWLIYAYGTEPIQLSMCMRSLPLNIVNAQRDLELLRQLLDKVPQHRPRWENAAFAYPPASARGHWEDEKR